MSHENASKVSQWGHRIVAIIGAIPLLGHIAAILKLIFFRSKLKKITSDNPVAPLSRTRLQL